LQIRVEDFIELNENPSENKMLEENLNEVEDLNDTILGTF